MKWLLLALVALIGSVTVALVALPDPGYVLIGYGKYSVETTLLVFAVVLLLAYFGLRGLAGLWHVPVRVHRWEQRREDRRLQRWFDEATQALSEGRVERAERRLARLLKSGQAPLQAYLSAAQAASQLGADERRDQYLQLALRRQPQAEPSVLIHQAELQLANKQSDQAQTTLARLHKLLPNNPATLRLEMQLYVQQHDWPRLRELLPALRRAQVLDHARWQKLAVQVYREQVLAFSSASDLDGLNAGWKQLPPPVQQDPALLAVYIEQLVRLGAHSRADQLLREHLGRHWDQRLVYLFGDVKDADIAAQQAQGERWLEKHSEDPVLLLALAKISLRNHLWGKARSYLEASIGHEPTPEAYRLLATLLEQIDEPEKAAECYRKGLALGSGGVSRVPSVPAESDQLTAITRSD
ncbi:MAG: heme biosynthesis protein HemY [Thiogranum sp.]|nr:heme biosynthesis protein HemY [Thiogranum sp.]